MGEGSCCFVACMGEEVILIKDEAQDQVSHCG